MPINVDKVRGAELATSSASWDAKAVMLYHLGVGAGVPPTDPGELEYTYEANLKVLPSFGVIPVFDVLDSLTSVPGLEFDPAMLLHGEQDLVLDGAIPTEAVVENSGRIVDIFDKGKAALAVVETKTRDGSGAPLFTNRFSLFIRGEGGFGGDAGPRPGNEPPTREPDVRLTSSTLPQQALLYRLSGDVNPLHADPDFARLGGFDRPILHGLCSYGVICKAVVDRVLGGDVAAVSRYQARFAGVVFPGETITTSVWHEGDTLVLSAVVEERGTPVITNAAITVR